jgi:hypothetical protein
MKKGSKKMLRHAVQVGATCGCGKIPAIISLDGQTTADARSIE